MNTQQPEIVFKSTTPVEGFDGGQLFKQGFLMRSVSKFITGGTEDALLPIPVFYCKDSNKILLASIPTELREEYKEIGL